MRSNNDDSADEEENDASLREWEVHQFLAAANVYATHDDYKNKRVDERILLVEWEPFGSQSFSPSWEEIANIANTPELQAFLKNASSANLLFVIYIGDANEAAFTNVPNVWRLLPNFPLLYSESTEQSLVADWRSAVKEHAWILTNHEMVADVKAAKTSAASSELCSGFASNDDDNVNDVLAMDISPAKATSSKPLESVVDSASVANVAPKSFVKRKMSFSENFSSAPESHCAVSSNSICSAVRHGVALQRALQDADKVVSSCLHNILQHASAAFAELATKKGLDLQSNQFVLYSENEPTAIDPASNARSIADADSTCSFSLPLKFKCTFCLKFDYAFGSISWTIGEDEKFRLQNVEFLQKNKFSYIWSRAISHAQSCKTAVFVDQASGAAATASPLTHRSSALPSATGALISLADFTSALQSSFLVAETHERSNDARIGPKCEPARALSDILKNSRPIVSSPFIQKWFRVGARRDVKLNGRVLPLQNLCFNSEPLTVEEGAAVLLERQGLELAKKLLLFLGVAQPRLKPGQALDENAATTTGGNNGFVSSPLQLPSVSSEGRAKARQVLSASTLQHKAASVMGLFRWLLVHCVGSRSFAAPTCHSVLLLVHRQLVLHVNAACNQSVALREITLASNISNIIEVHLQMRNVLQSLSLSYSSYLRWLMYNVTFDGNAVSGGMEDLESRCSLLFSCTGFVPELVASFFLASIYCKGGGRPQMYINMMLVQYGLNPNQMSSLYGKLVSFLHFVDLDTGFCLTTMRDKVQTSKLPLIEPLLYDMQIACCLIALNIWWLRRRFSLNAFPQPHAAQTIGPNVASDLAVPVCVCLSSSDTSQITYFAEDIEMLMMQLLEHGPRNHKWVQLRQDGGPNIASNWKAVTPPKFDQLPNQLVLPPWLRSIGNFRTASASLQAFLLSSNPDLFAKMSLLNRHCAEMRSSMHYSPHQEMMATALHLKQYGEFVGLGSGSYPPPPGVTAAAAGIAKMRQPLVPVSMAIKQLLQHSAMVMFPNASSSILAGPAASCYFYPFQLWNGYVAILERVSKANEAFRPETPLILPLF